MDFKKEKHQIILVLSYRVTKKKDKKNKDVVFKIDNLLGAWRKTREIVIIVARKDIEGGIERNILKIVIEKRIRLHTSSMFIIENYLTTLHFSSWVLEIKCGFHICNYIPEVKKVEDYFKVKWTYDSIMK